MLRRVLPVSKLFSTRDMSTRIGFVGLGHMGSKMVKNIADDGNSLYVFDIDPKSVEKVKSHNIHEARSVIEVVKTCNVVISMLPNDAVLTHAAKEMLENSRHSEFTHISCSTVSPATSRSLAELYASKGMNFVACPVFARPDGIARREAVWIVSGNEHGRNLVKKLLSSSGRIEDYGNDAGAANVVKLCGNYMIAATIETIGESMTLAEKNGVNPQQVMSLLSSTIFNCLIHKGYGQRVSERDHRPGGFSLELGLKDVTLVNQAARAVGVPMPFLSILVDRFTSAKAKGRADLDWSAIGLNIAEDAGLDVSKDVERNKKA